MILIDKNTFIRTISIMRGEKQLSNIFVELKGIIEKQYNVIAVNFKFKKMKNNIQQSRYSLNIILLKSGDYQKMCKHSSYDEDKQKFISDKFYELALKYKFKSVKHKKDVWIYYTDFYNELRDETNKMASKEAIAYIKANNSSLPISIIHCHFDSIYIFFETDAQVTQYSNNSKIKSEYFSILKKYDEFNCFDYNNFSVNYDSKEHLDREFNGSLFYYFR